LLLSEVMAAPAAGGEWIELRAGDEGAVGLDTFRLRDADGDWRALPAGEALGPGERIVLVEDAAAFAGHWTTLPPDAGTACGGAARVLEPSGWPSLNNGAPESRSYADRVLLADARGVVDHVTIGRGSVPGAGEAPAGRSLERHAAMAAGSEAANWTPCLAAAGGTPGCTNSVARPAPAGGSLRAAPNPFSPGGPHPALHLSFVLGDAERSYDLRVFDLWGHLVRDLAGDDLGPGPRHVVWDGRDDVGRSAPAGGYVVLLRCRATDGAIAREEKLLAALASEAGR
jgi:hypothetical protein